LDCTVEGELSVAKFYTKLAMTSHFFFLPLFPTRQSQRSVSSTIMAPPLDDTQHFLIESDQQAGQELRSIASHNNGMPTFEIIIYIGYRSTSLTNLYLSMNPAAKGWPIIRS
jgi:hypothetical protein